MNCKILTADPSLHPYAPDIRLRMENYEKACARLLSPGQTLKDFANGHHYFGFHRGDGGWHYREWAPGAEALFLTGDFNGWDRYAHPMTKEEGGVFTLFLPGKDALWDGCNLMTVVRSCGQESERIPLYATRVVQDPVSFTWNCRIHEAAPFPWTDKKFRPKKTLFIYECHIGMAQEEGKVGTYREFTQNILPRVRSLGYNTLQLMAVMEHPYYASFGYQVTNFFAAASRFGTPEELKELVNTAHKLGIGVLLDVVHSHAAPNTREGMNQFDGTEHQFFHPGHHPAWNTKCFLYGKDEVIHFLLSNLKFWLEEYHFDGFRFDGVTSMLYRDHGLGVSFDRTEKYFSPNTDPEAVTYLQLACETVRQVNPNAVLIAEEMSAMPGLCLPVEAGGIGFDYRLAMGEPDLWVRLLTETRDEDWDLNQIYYQLTCRRPGEKVIGYCESHDQALVGDKTLMFRMCDAAMYRFMDKNSHDPTVQRGMALHKLLRLLTMTLGGEGYLTFMGNEFGHPEWIDFPREGNGWSYHYCRRQWHLAEDPSLKYSQLLEFEKAMAHFLKRHRLLKRIDRQLYLDNRQKILVYQKGTAVFAVNLHPTQSREGLFLPMPKPGSYRVVLSTDDYRFGGDGRIWHESYEATLSPEGIPGFRFYLPCRTAAVFLPLTEKTSGH